MSKLKIAVLVSGNGSNLQALLDATKDNRIKGSIELVIADNADAYALIRAKNQGVRSVSIDRKALKSKADFDAKLLQQLGELKPDLIILAGFLSILPETLVKEYQGKIINIHPSLIPAFCGKGFYGERVHQAVIAYGVKLTGATVHFVDEGTDTGPIVLQRTVAVAEEDDAKSIAEKVLEIEHSLLVEAVALFCEGKISLEGRKVKISSEVPN